MKNNKLITEPEKRTTCYQERKINYGRRSFLAFILVLAIYSVSGQQLHPIKRVFVGTSVTQQGHDMLYKFYFIIGVETIKYQGKIYNSLVMSEDSAEVCGYVRFDSVGKKMLFISAYWKDSNMKSECPNVNKVQTLFSFHQGVSAELCFPGDLGRAIYVFAKEIRKGEFTMQFLMEDILPSHSERIEMFYLNNDIYPSEVTMINQVGDRFFLRL